METDENETEITDHEAEGDTETSKPAVADSGINISDNDKDAESDVVLTTNNATEKVRLMILSCQIIKPPRHPN